MVDTTNTVKRAIIMAAGIGKRMQPLTLSTPKPLVKVNGIRMIDSVVDALNKNGIKEIYVVAGYLKEQFYEWAKDKDVSVIENPYYDVCNNISSLYVARNHLENCMILDGDQVINNPDVLSPYFKLSGYNAVWCEGHTNEWLMTEENGIVKSCSRTGGSHGWQLYSVSRWSQEDGRKLKNHLEQEFESGNRNIYWDDVAIFCHFKDYSLGIYEMNRNDIVEIDGLDELAAIDPSYEKFLTGKII